MDDARFDKRDAVSPERAGDGGRVRRERPTARTGSTGRSRLLAALALGAVLAIPTASAAQAPDDDWRTFETTHFQVTFPEPLEDLARRAAERAERAYVELEAAFLEPPEDRIDLVVTDHVDQSNGFAALFPSNRITIFARPPVDAISLQYFDDWLEILITHELVHTFHLDHTSAFGSAIRSIMGRYPAPWPLFPEVGLPTWAVEGIATYYESALTESGRTSGTYHDMVLRTAAAEGRFEDLDQVSGFSPLWPGGTRPYIYGSKFFEYLLDKHGADAMSAFVEAVAGQWVPYRMNAAARDAFGTTFAEEWGGFRQRFETAAEARARATERSTLPDPETVVDDGRFALYPQVGPDGATLALSRSDGRTNTQIRAFPTTDGAPRKLTRTNGFATFSWAPDGSIVFQQIENVDPYRARNDLYRLAPDGSVRRITHGARLSHPSVGPDGRLAVAVQDGEGANGLVEVDLTSGAVRAVTARSSDELWSSPRVSPDGRWIAASRWKPGALLDIVVLDRNGEIVAEVTADRAIDSSPWWAPDGHALVWSSDRNGVPNLYGARVDAASGTAGPVFQITELTTGAAYPSIDPDGRWIYFSAYHADGWHVERVPFDPDGWAPTASLDPRFESGGRAAADAFAEEAGGPTRTYSAGRSLMPRYWEPIFLPSQSVRSTDVVGYSVGIGIRGEDLVGRHAYQARVTYEPDFGRTQGGVSYSYAGMGTPTITVSANQFYDADPALAQVDDSTTRPVFLVEREQRLFATLSFPPSPSQKLQQRVAHRRSGADAGRSSRTGSHHQ